MSLNNVILAAKNLTFDAATISITMAANGRDVYIKIADALKSAIDAAGSITSATNTTLGTVKVTNGNGLTLNGGTIAMSSATNAAAGAVKVTNGNGLALEGGVVSMASATDTDAGAVSVEVGNGLGLQDGMIYMDVATDTEAGTVKVPSANGLAVVGDGTLGVASATTDNLGTVRIASSDPTLAINAGILSSVSRKVKCSAGSTATTAAKAQFDASAKKVYSYYYPRRVIIESQQAGETAATLASYAVAPSNASAPYEVDISGLPGTDLTFVAGTVSTGNYAVYVIMEPAEA